MLLSRQRDGFRRCSLRTCSLSIILSTHYNSDQGLIAAERKIDVRGRVEEEGRGAQINQKAITDKGQRRKKHSVED